MGRNQAFEVISEKPYVMIGFVTINCKFMVGFITEYCKFVVGFITKAN